MTDYSNPLDSKQYFNQFNGDFDNRQEIEFFNQEMYQYAKIAGIPVTYMPIDVDSYKSEYDVVYGENTKPKWDRKFLMVAILEDFTQETRQFSGIGLENIDEVTMYIHKSMFDEIVGKRSNTDVKNKRGAFGPVASDQIMTNHNGIVYDVLEGGLHFLSSQAQHFGHKFWYKVTCKVRQVSDATIGVGEQYGGVPDMNLEDKYKGNPQFLLTSPTREEIYAGTGTVPVNTNTDMPSGTCSNNEYLTTGSSSDPIVGIPDNLIDQSGNVSEQFIGNGMKTDSTFNDQDEIKTEEDAIINPDTDHKVDPTSPEGQQFGPSGRIIDHKRKELFSDWD